MSAPSNTYALDDFSGPLPLLLQLIQSKEKDIHSITIHDIIDQYYTLASAYSLEENGLFLSQTASLMLIKSKHLLEEEVEEEDMIEESDFAVQKILEKSSLRLVGLMTMAEKKDSGKSPRDCFAKLYKLRDRLEREFSIQLPELSMGMSQDYEEAILE